FSLMRVCPVGEQSNANRAMHSRLRTGHNLGHIASPRLADECCIRSRFALMCAWHWFTGPHCWLVQMPWPSTVALMIAARLSW
ncbi:MAG: hypothetical protein ACK56I_16195, partial [bacterium]